MKYARVFVHSVERRSGDTDLEHNVSLRQAFLKNKDNKELFHDPGRFRKVNEKRWQPTARIAPGHARCCPVGVEHADMKGENDQ